MSTNSTNQLWQLLRDATIVDLSVTTGPDMPCSPPEGQRMNQYLFNTYTDPRGVFLEYVQIHDDHTGTHIDAPSHFTPSLESGLPHATEFGTVTIEQLDLKQLIGPAVVVDVRSLVEAAPKGTHTHLAESPWISREFLEEWEERNGGFQPGEIVLFRADWSDKYYKPLPEGFEYDRSHPAPSAEAIEFLFDRGVRHIGVDGRGIGAMQDDNTPHWAALGRGMYATENLTNLGKLPTRGAVFIFLPHKFKGATGGMGRAIGLIG
ncbi:cyclase family protein (plasmid) [Shinella sp. H4-D48]|uniref:cyclase family protein n=1 Tax=Shinella sp. H4-D48 TaxID=2925841 RepID=UPI001F5302D5|nr:cyclase family protein [Shinella sp. H4-D48]UNK40005.1 cyclase family protein [Shinella sp. H4-D48]